MFFLFRPLQVHHYGGIYKGKQATKSVKDMCVCLQLTANIFNKNYEKDLKYKLINKYSFTFWCNNLTKQLQATRKQS